MELSNNFFKLIEEFEGWKGTAYLDPVGIPTIGYGFTKGVKMGDTITKAESNARLRHEIADYTKAIMEVTGGNLNQNEFDALACLSWNIGIAGLKKSTVIKQHNAGNKEAAARAFSMWNKAGGKVFAGLVRRRAAEASLYLTPVEGEIEEDMPQAIDSPRPLVTSKINVAQAAAGGVASIAAVNETLKAFNELQEQVASFSHFLLPVALGSIVILCAFTIWQRLQHRKAGIF